jgi:hypothetical protein
MADPQVIVMINPLRLMVPLQSQFDFIPMLQYLASYSRYRVTVVWEP